MLGEPNRLHRSLAGHGEGAKGRAVDAPNPSATMADISGVALSTAQGWVTRARARGLLPPGRQGRAG